MKILPLFLAMLIASVPTVSVYANALTAGQMAPAPAPEHLPKQAIASLEVQPATVELHSKYGYAQLLVTAHLADGTTADVTRLAKFVAPAEAAISPAGQLTPVKNGAGSVSVQVGGKSATVSVAISGIEKTPVPDFIRDVNPVMTKLGCNAGTCHGAKDGKVGFKLSLRGYDPLFDVRALKDDLAGRRLNVASPDDSLMLLKSTAGVPHEGGQRTRMGEKYYDILRSWIADGAKLNPEAARVTKIEVAPKDPVVQEIGALQQTRIIATFADGTVRDVTAEAFIDSGNTDVATTDGGGLIRTLRRGEAPLLARYEGNYAATTITVMGDRSGFTWQQPETWNRVDELVASKWQRMKIAPSGVCTDAEFLRRVYLDLTGLPPSPDEVRAFTADERETRTKRAEIIEKLIGSPDYLEHWTNKWCDLLQVNSKFLGREGTDSFRAWIRKELETNTPYDELVRKIVTASGSTKDNPAANYWKILRNPEDLVENTTHLFLATRFNCNKCHDHPFERWTQDQYYQLGAFFSQVQRAKDPQSGARQILGTAVEKALPLWEVIGDGKTGEMTHLRTNKPATPKFPFEAKPVAVKQDASRREQLSSWLTSADNRYFAMSYANRIWGYLTGVGVIEPLDDIRAGNPPTNPELLDYLTKEFIGSKFDVRHLMRLVCNSRTYQLAISTNKWNEDDKINYSHATARRLPAEVLYDAVIRVTGSQSRLPGVAPGTRAQQLPDSAIDLPSGFLAALGRPARESACECERSSDIRLGSVMSLLSGPAVADAIGDTNSGIAKLALAEKDDRKLVDEVFLRVLSRPATETELKRTLEAWGRLDGEHQRLDGDWQAKEAEQAPIIAKMEKERVESIATAKTELARYEKEVAPKVAEAEKQRLDRVAANDKAVKEYEKNSLPAAQDGWEAALPAQRTYTSWQPVPPADLKSVAASGGVKIEKQKDGAVTAISPAIPAASDYTVVVDTKLSGITGFLVEVLPDATLPSFGPGTATGNFVLTELTCDVTPRGEGAPGPVKFKAAFADYAQKDYTVEKAIDNNNAAGDNGWAIGGGAGQPHTAAFALATPIGTAKGGSIITLKMFQRRAGFHLGHFRLWYTTDAHVSLGLPAPVAAAIKAVPEARTPEQKAALTAYFRRYHPEIVKRDLTLAQSRLPLPTDPGIVERRDTLAKAEEPIRLDGKLVQLRADAAQSKIQLANKRLTGAQDLVWALVNNPAFLFNH
jgi:hypothetical protein